MYSRAHLYLEPEAADAPQDKSVNLLNEIDKPQQASKMNDRAKQFDKDGSLFSPIIAINFAFLEMNVALLLR